MARLKALFQQDVGETSSVSDQSEAEFVFHDEISSLSLPLPVCDNDPLPRSDRQLLRDADMRVLHVSGVGDEFLP